MRYTSLVIVAALAVASCGSGGEGSSSPASNDEAAASAQSADPCSLVTAEEVGAVIGDKIVETAPADGSCTYATEMAQGASVTVDSDLSDGKGAMDIARTAAGTMSDMGTAAAAEGGAAGQDVNLMLGETGNSELGDESFFGPNSQLHVRKANSYIAVQPPIMRSQVTQGNPMISSDDRRKIAVAIAEKALARLP